jgi:hypothetical protein
MSPCTFCILSLLRRLSRLMDAVSAPPIALSRVSKRLPMSLYTTVCYHASPSQLPYSLPCFSLFYSFPTHYIFLPIAYLIAVTFQLAPQSLHRIHVLYPHLFRDFILHRILIRIPHPGLGYHALFRIA